MCNLVIHTCIHTYLHGCMHTHIHTYFLKFNDALNTTYMHVHIDT